MLNKFQFRFAVNNLSSGAIFTGLSQSKSRLFAVVSRHKAVRFSPPRAVWRSSRTYSRHVPRSLTTNVRRDDDAMNWAILRVATLTVDAASEWVVHVLRDHTLTDNSLTTNGVTDPPQPSRRPDVNRSRCSCYGPSSLIN